MPTLLWELAGVEARNQGYLGLHVLTKIFIPFFLSINILLVKDPLSAVMLVVLSFILLMYTRVPLSLLKNYIVLIISVTSFIALSFMVFTKMPGQVYLDIPLFSIEAEKGTLEWRITITDTAISYTILFVARIVSMILSATLFLATVSDRDIVWGLRSLKLPFGIAIAASLFFRGIHLFVNDFFTIRDAMMSKGVDFEKTPLTKKMSLYASMLIPLISLMITRSYEVSLALESKGISPTTRSKTLYHSYNFTNRDLAFILVGLLSTLLFAGWNIWM